MKKLATMAISVVLIACMVAGGSLAYLQDSDSDVNVMTLGNVDIVQHEYERDADGNLVDFTPAKPLYPAVYSDGVLDWDDDLLEVNDGSYKVFDASMKNVLDKIVTVENKGKSDAYVRTMIAFESPEGFNDDLLHINYNGTDTTMGDWIYVEIDGIRYAVTSFTYNEVLKAKTISAPSLLQVYLDPTATNDDVTACDGNNNGTYDILVLSQAVQAAGFDDAKTALDTAFGKASEKAAEWFGGEEFDIPTTVFTLAELRAAMAVGGEVILGADISVASDELLYKADGGHKDGSAFFVKNDTVIDLNGHDIIVDSANAWAEVFFMNFGAGLTITGEGDIKANCSIACVYDAGSALNIEGGNFYVTANNDMLYAIYGKINVSGGTFTTSYWNTINIYGSGRTQLVDVSGGSFKNWNPASSPDGNLLADGYKVVSEEIDGVTWYTVVAE